VSESHLSEPVVGGDHYPGGVARHGIPGEHDSGRLGVHHLLDYDGHPGQDRLTVLAPAIKMIIGQHTI
jgi:hypothetical protein